MFFIHKPKFPIPRTLIDISQKILWRKNCFPKNNSFSPEISHIHKPTKIGFPRNQPKMHQLHKNTTSSKMVVRGWYMTRFDRRDLLNSEKKVWDGFHNLPALPGPICDFSRIFREFRVGTWILENRFFNRSSPKKMFENWFFSNFAFFPKTMILELHFGIFTSCVLPLLEAVEFFEPLMNTFSYSFSSPNFNTAHLLGYGPYILPIINLL